MKTLKGLILGAAIVSGCMVYGITDVSADEFSNIKILLDELVRAGKISEAERIGYEEGYRNGMKAGRNEEFLDNFQREYGHLPGPLDGSVDTDVGSDVFSNSLDEILDFKY